MVSTSGRKPIARSIPSLETFPSVAFEPVPKLVWLVMAFPVPLRGIQINPIWQNEQTLSSAVQRKWTESSSELIFKRFSFLPCLLQATDGAMSLALCPQVVSQTPQRSELSPCCVPEAVTLIVYRKPLPRLCTGSRYLDCVQEAITLIVYRKPLPCLCTGNRYLVCVPEVMDTYALLVWEEVCIYLCSLEHWGNVIVKLYRTKWSLLSLLEER